MGALVAIEEDNEAPLICDELLGPLFADTHSSQVGNIHGQSDEHFRLVDDGTDHPTANKATITHISSLPLVDDNGSVTCAS